MPDPNHADHALPSPVHLSSLLGHLRTHKGRMEVAFYRAVVKRAALLAFTVSSTPSWFGPTKKGP